MEMKLSNVRVALLKPWYLFLGLDVWSCDGDHVSHVGVFSITSSLYQQRAGTSEGQGKVFLLINGPSFLRQTSENQQFSIFSKSGCKILVEIISVKTKQNKTYL